MTRHILTGKARCDCIACFGFRLAVEMFLVGLALILLISALIGAHQSARPLIENTSAAPLHDAAQREANGEPADRRAYDLCPFTPVDPRRRGTVHQV